MRAAISEKRGIGWDAQSNVVRCRSHLGDEGIASKEHLLASGSARRTRAASPWELV
jgi:hypothetical protein